MRRGLTDAGEWVFLGKINKTNKLKLPRRGKTGQLAWLDRAGQDKTRQDKIRSRQDKTRQDKTRQGKAGTGNIRQRTGTGLQTQGDYKGSK